MSVAASFSVTSRPMVETLQMVVCYFEHRIFNITNLMNNPYMAPSMEFQTQI